MPVVPFSPSGPQPLPEPDAPFMDMAAAMMKTERDKEVARGKSVGEQDFVGSTKFGKEVLKSGRRSDNIEDERTDDVIMEHNEKLEPLELKKAPTS